MICAARIGELCFIFAINASDRCRGTSIKEDMQAGGI